jgi:hypothetical protein
VAVGNDGMIVVGAPGTDRNNALDAGAIYAFNGAGQATPLPPAPVTEAGAQFGFAVARSGDGFIVGAPNADVGGDVDQGAAYSYRMMGGAAQFDETISPATAGVGDKFGSAVAMLGNRMVVGAPGTNNGQGRGYLFEDTGGPATQQATFEPGTLGAGAQLGTAVAISDDYVLMGAPAAPVGSAQQQGLTLVYPEPDAGFRAFQAANGVLQSADGAAGDRFGSAVVLTGTGAFVASPLRDVALSGGGVATDQGVAEPWVLDRILVAGFEDR